MKPNFFIMGPQPTSDLWYIDLAQESPVWTRSRNSAFGFQYNATTKTLTELSLSDIMDLLKFSNF